jgi:hypothetical protein
MRMELEMAGSADREGANQTNSRLVSSQYSCSHEGCED